MIILVLMQDGLFGGGDQFQQEIMGRLQQEAFQLTQIASVSAGGARPFNGAPGTGASLFTHSQSWAGLQEVVAVVANAVGPALAAAAAGPQVQHSNCTCSTLQYAQISASTAYALMLSVQIR